MSGRVELTLKRATGFTLDAAFDIPDRGITVLFGPSGCGKTTVLRCTAGLERAEGLVEVNSHVWQDSARKIFVPAYERKLGYVFQEASLFPHLDVEENLTFGLKRAKTADGMKRLEEAVALLGIADLRKRSVSELSGGERQRVAIARALAMTPDVILMDEPLAALDWERKQEILPWLERLRDELHIPMLYVTHSADEMGRLADRLVCLEKGHITAAGELETVLMDKWPGRFAEGAASVLAGKVTDVSRDWGTLTVLAEGTPFEISTGPSHPIGESVRVRVLARDVSVCLEKPERTSIRNIFPASLEAVEETGEESAVMLKLRVKGGCRLLARVTRRSVSELGLAPGMDVYAQVKAAAIIL
ncbi:MAG: hypothetical protein ACFWTZ_02680 [Burkholderia sp.]|jgi:molybdate transport system ATP-binding protein